VGLFASTTFASAFLIFLVQPIVAKRILPWFGGVPAVWSLCLAFYQTALFAGYAYAHLLIARARARTQLFVHAAVVAAAAIALPVLPSDAWKPEGTGDPSAQILAMLLANVALPFFALAATGPLVAAWFARRHPARSPYPLYAVSNAGSLAALVAYPFALEPRLGLSATGRIWSGAFAATTAAVIACAALAQRGDDAVAQHVDPDGPEIGDARRPIDVAFWILLSACAVVLLMGITNQLCLGVASVPFLWIVPLVIYLWTLIAAFGAPRLYRRLPFVALAVFAYFAKDLLKALHLVDPVVDVFGGAPPFEIARLGLLLLASCWILHGELYRLRPPPRSLTSFYLCTSGGGALGGLFVGLFAPRAFGDFYELPIGLGGAVVLLLAACRYDATGWLARGAPRGRLFAAGGLTAVALVALASTAFARKANLLHRERSFFGVSTVNLIEGSRWRVRTLSHGPTMHGLQIEPHPDRATAYFGPGTGIEIALSQRAPGIATEIGVIGLGAGTLAAYGRENDHLRFFEIDPAVIHLARDAGYFTFLSRCQAKLDIVLGDGRISLARERARGAPRFDYLVIDAYSGDAVPVHLLTRESLAVYFDAIEPDGLVAFHVSTAYFDLAPIVFRLAQDAGLHAVEILNHRDPIPVTLPAVWVFVSRSEARIRSLAEAANQRASSRRDRLRTPRVIFPTPEIVARAPLWTDDYSNLFRALKRLSGDASARIMESPEGEPAP
jgi:spermidine synthase